MADISLNAEGLDALIGKLQTAQQEVTRKVGDAVQRTTDRGARLAKENTPVQTGRLQAEIYGVSTALTGLIASPTPYAGFVDRGTSKMAPRRHMGRTFDVIAPEFVDAVQQAGRPDL